MTPMNYRSKQGNEKTWVPPRSFGADYAHLRVRKETPNNYLSTYPKPGNLTPYLDAVSIILLTSGGP